MKKILNSIHPDDDNHYEKMGLRRGTVEKWEDGARTKGKSGEYEWWYFDNRYDDGTIVVIFFFTKSPIDVGGKIKPMATIEITYPDGRRESEVVNAKPEDSFYDKDGCNIRIGESTCCGDLRHYEIKFAGQRISASVTLDGTIEAWRSQTGSILFGDNEEHYFAWLPAIPEGKSKIEFTIGGVTTSLSGSGYHDHNWGNISMLKLMHHWYWGRAKIGDYKVISSWITAEKKYGYKEFDVFMLAKRDRIIGDNSNHTLRFLPSGEYIDEYTGKNTYANIVYEYETPEGEFYRISYIRREDINRTRFVDELSGIKRIAAKLLGIDGAYIRFSGTAKVERLVDGKVVECAEEPSAVWEMMYFGKSGADKAVD